MLLRRVNDADVLRRMQMGTHPLIVRGYGIVRDRWEPVSRESAQEWFESMNNEWSWAIDAGWGLIGSAYFHNVRGEEARFAIGMFSPRYVGRGFGTRATQEALAIGKERGLRRVELLVLADNVAAITTYERCGFVETHRSRDPGMPVEDIHMTVLL
jgi:RimJ/RimL family protein N-acetyltransferase